MNLDTYKDLFLNQKRDQSPITDIMGKITRGKTSKDFKTLTHDPTRKIVMLMGSDRAAFQQYQDLQTYSERS